MIDKPSEKEEQWIKEQEIKRRKKLDEEAEIRGKEEEAAGLKELHWMRCPKCGQQLEAFQHHNIALDKCSGCEGVWLDKGELESLVNLEVEERSTFFHTIKSIFK
jgi:hypothetical protein